MGEVNSNSTKNLTPSSGFTLADSARLRILNIKAKEENKDKYLRVEVLGGGCGGLQYNFKLEQEKLTESDFKITESNQLLAAADEVSINFLQDCVIEYVEELGASYFKVDNPNAKSSCGCGNSFSV